MNVIDVDAVKVLEFSMIAIYSPHKYIVPLFDQFPHKQFYDDVDEFKKSTASIKIAFITKLSLVPDFDYVSQFVDHCDIVLVIDGEFHEWHCLNSDSYSWKNVYWIGPGYTKKNNEFIISYQHHLNHIQKLYRRPSVRLQLNRLNPYQSKSMSFDALLGGRRPPRLYIMDQIKTHGLESKIISNIFSQTEYKTQPMHQLPGFVWEDDYRYADNSQNSNHINCMIHYHGAITSLGNIIPISTYNQTAFSILSETEHNNSVYMLTEKTAKVALGRRVFVAFAGQGFLQIMRDIGFRTFDGIVDESYDQIENDQDRWQAAFDQVLRLCESDQETILSQATSILEHNFDLMMEHPWQLHGDQAINAKLAELVEKLNQTQ